MITPINLRPSVPSGYEATDHGSGQTCDTAEGAKNLWVRTGRHLDLTLATFNGRTLSSEGSLEVLFEKLAGIKWDVIGLSEVRRMGEAFTVLKNGYVLCYRGLEDKREPGAGFLVNKDIAGNIEEYYSLNERVAGLVINRRYKLNVVQGYSPTSNHDDQLVERFSEDVDNG